MTTSVSRLLAAVPLVLIGLVLGQWGHARWTAGTADHSPAATALSDAYTTVRRSYVDSVSAARLTDSILRHMLNRLDSYSVYIEPDRLRHIENTFEGSFEGIGISYERIDGPNGQDTLFVASVTPEGPSAEAGLRAGDRIVAVNDTPAVGWANSRIRDRLMGPEGSTVRVTLRRPGRPEPIRTTITRGTVPLETIEAAYMIDEATGYLRLSRFARTTHRELREGLRRLNRQGMERLILDLRGNAGGLLSMAQEVADEFLVDGQLIVTARSRHDEFAGARYAESGGLYEERPLVVLVDGRSASASEIVAGALQDHDRALLVGRRTFGKGLVQRQFDLEGGSAMRLTVARYHTPSGRQVQRPTSEAVGGSPRAPFDTAAAPDTAAVADSLLHRTDAGRVVIGGGGIWPDQVVPAPRPGGACLDSVRAHGLLDVFTRRWVDAHADSLRARWDGRLDAFVRTYAPPASAYDRFRRYAARHGIGAPPASEEEARSVVESHLHRRLALRLFGPAGALRVRNAASPVVATALQSWGEAVRRARRYPIR